MLNKNEFGNLVKAYRKQRGWTQGELADKWGYSRGYVSQIEAGIRRLDSTIQLIRLADLLDIPQERLEAIGKGIPTRQKSQASLDDNSEILQMLLAPGREMVHLAYIVWLGDQAPIFEERLRDLVIGLEQALTAYHGEFRQPAQQLLAYTHQMRGRIALDRLDFAAASGHFSAVIELGEELSDPDIITMGHAYQGSILRKRGRFQSALRSYEMARPFAAASESDTRGVYHLMLSTVHADAGHEQDFLRAIDAALAIAADQRESIDGLANDFSLDDVLWAKAGGFSELWMPEKALGVYAQTDQLRPWRPMREQGAYLIDKGEAYLRLGELEQGVKLSLEGLRLAETYRSKRHIGWIEKTYSRLLPLPFGQDKLLRELGEELAESRQKQKGW